MAQKSMRESSQAWPNLCVCVYVCVFKKTTGRVLLIGHCVSTLRNCIDFCHLRIGSCPVGARRDPPGRLFSSPSEAHISVWQRTAAKEPWTLSITLFLHIRVLGALGEICERAWGGYTFTVSLIHSFRWRFLISAPRLPEVSASHNMPRFVTSRQLR